MSHDELQHWAMIKTFADRKTEEIYTRGKSERIAPDMIKRVIRRLAYIDLAICLEDLKVPLSNRLHVPKGNRKGQYAILINH